MIDLIFTNTVDKIVCSGVSHVGIRDHSLVYAFRKLSTGPGAKLKGGGGGGMGGDPPPQLPISQGTGEVCRAKMWNLTCENKNTIPKYYFVTD